MTPKSQENWNVRFPGVWKFANKKTEKEAQDPFPVSEKVKIPTTFLKELSFRLRKLHQVNFQF